jgi:hypothetical protein
MVFSSGFSPAFLTQTVELHHMALDLEIVPLGKRMLGFRDEVQLLMQKVVIVDNRFTAGANQMMMVSLSREVIHELVSSPTVPEVELENHAHLCQQLERPIDRR